MTSISLQPATPVKPITLSSTDAQGPKQPEQAAVRLAPHVADISQRHENKLASEMMSLKLVSADLLNRPTTKLGQETEFQGEYKSKKKHVGVSVAGKVSGSFALGEGSVFVLESGGVAQACRVEAETVVIAGTFAGEIVCGSLEVLPGATVEGGISYVEICIQRGAKVDAKHQVLDQV